MMRRGKEHILRKVLRYKGKKVWFYIALYPVRWTAQSALHSLYEVRQDDRKQNGQMRANKT